MIDPLRRTIRALRRLWREERGTATTETAILLPVLGTLLAGSAYVSAAYDAKFESRSKATACAVQAAVEGCTASISLECGPGSGAGGKGEARISDMVTSIPFVGTIVSKFIRFVSRLPLIGRLIDKLDKLPLDGRKMSKSFDIPGVLSRLGLPSEFEGIARQACTERKWPTPKDLIKTLFCHYTPFC